jgi:hypothetical protein
MMRSAGANYLPVLLAGALLLCHGVFGALHLVCDPTWCAGEQHSAEHRPAQAGVAANAHEHPAGHEASTGYFAVVAGILGLLLGLFPKGVLPRVGVRARRHRLLRRATIISRLARPPTSPVLQVFRF